MMSRSLLVALALFAGACASDADPQVADSPAAQDDQPTSSTHQDVEANNETTSSQGDTTSAEDAALDEGATTTSPETTVTPTTVAAPPSGPLQVDCASIGRASVGLQTGSITSGGVEYKYQWTVPSSYDGSPIPVVLDFHAIGSNGAQQAVFAGWAALAEAEGFLAVQPTGIAVAPDDRASWELPQFDTDDRDDIAMVVDLLDHIAANVCVDSQRIYATGMSNGALFTSTVVCDLSTFIAAAVSVAGVTHDESCQPERPVPYLAFHGTADTTVPFRGGGETTLEGSEGGAFFDQVMPEEFAEFAADFGCTENVDEIITELVTRTSYDGCTNDVELGFYTIDGGGHTWPGSEVSNALVSLGVTNMEIDATSIAWEFFQRHTL